MRLKKVYCIAEYKKLLSVSSTVRTPVGIENMEFSELPEGIRVKLDKENERQLWDRIDECGGVSDFSDTFGVSVSKLYNWKNKDVFYPVEFVRRVMEGNASENVRAIKGEGRSRPLYGVDFPLGENDELLTRINTSVKVNREGVPVYISQERSLVERFSELLSVLGEVPRELYSRQRYELRYPKYIHEILLKMDYEPVLEAQVDERGEIGDGKAVLPDREVDLEKIGRLYSRDKRLQKALETGDSEVLEEIISEGAGEVRSLV